jgi:hypothetical protein
VALLVVINMFEELFAGRTVLLEAKHIVAIVKVNSENNKFSHNKWFLNE